MQLSLPPKAKWALPALHPTRRVYHLTQQYSASTPPYHWRLPKSRKDRLKGEEDTDVGSAVPKPFAANSAWHLASRRPDQITVVYTDVPLQTTWLQKVVLQPQEKPSTWAPRWRTKTWTSSASKWNYTQLIRQHIAKNLQPRKHLRVRKAEPNQMAGPNWGSCSLMIIRLCTSRARWHFSPLPKHPQACCCVCAGEVKGYIRYLFDVFHSETTQWLCTWCRIPA